MDCCEVHVTELFASAPLEDTLIRPDPLAPSLERQRLYLEGEILPALYHYIVRVERPTHHVELVVAAQHEISAAKTALCDSAPVRNAAIEEGSVTVAGVSERGSLSEYRVRIRVDQDGAVAIPS
jgi:hypothetical protein